MRRVTLAALLLLSCGGQPESKAQGIRVCVRNVGAVSKADADTIISLANAIVQHDMGLPLQVVSYEEITIPGLDTATLSTDMQYARLRAVREHNKAHPCGVAAYYMLPPMTDGTRRWFGGVGDFGCITQPVSFGQAGAWSSHVPPRDRLFGSAVIFAHELAHGWNCDHLNVREGWAINVMDEAATAYVDDHPELMHYLPKSVQTFLQCGGYEIYNKLLQRRLQRCEWLKRQGRRRQAKKCEKVKPPLWKLSTAPDVIPAVL